MKTLLCRLISYFMLVCIVTYSNCINMSVKANPGSQDQDNKWEQTVAQFKVIASKKDDLKLKDTVLDVLVQAVRLPLKNLLESDRKTLISFEITYVASIKLEGDTEPKKRSITQYGLYRTLHPELQKSFINYYSTTPINIIFSTANPISIQFIVNNSFIPAPILLTKSIDVYWKQ